MLQITPVPPSNIPAGLMAAVQQQPQPEAQQTQLMQVEALQLRQQAQNFQASHLPSAGTLQLRQGYVTSCHVCLFEIRV